MIKPKCNKFESFRFAGLHIAAKIVRAVLNKVMAPKQAAFLPTSIDYADEEEAVVYKIANADLIDIVSRQSLHKAYLLRAVAFEMSLK